MFKTKTNRHPFRFFFRLGAFAFGFFALSIFSSNLFSAKAAGQVSLSAAISTGEGRPASDGEYDVRFALYSVDRADVAQSEGAPLWQETQKVAVSGGRMRVFLGSVTTLPSNLDFAANEYYLGIKVGGDSEMVPRKRLSAALMALNASHADSATHADTADTAKKADTAKTADTAEEADTAKTLNGKKVGTGSGNIPLLGAGGKIVLGMLPTGTGVGQLITGSDSRLHLQNTDTGTTSTSFSIGSGAEASSGNFDLTVSSDSAKPTLRYNGSISSWEYSNNGSDFYTWTGFIPADGGTMLGDIVFAPTQTFGGATLAELGYSQGLTGNIQDQLDDKASLSHTHAASDIVSGTLSVARGGTGIGSYTVGDLLYASGASTLSKLGIGSNGQVLTVSSGNLAWTSTVPSTPHDLLSAQHSDTTAGTVARGDLITGQGASATWSRLALGNSGYILRSDGTDAAWSPTTAITSLGTITTGTWNGSTIGVAYGGTGLTATPTNGQLLIGNGTGYVLTTLTQSSGITVTNGAGSITIAATLGASVDLTSEVTGVLPVANGGTGAASLNDLIALTTHTTGNYVQSVANGNGISGGNGGSEGAALTLALGSLSSDWTSTGTGNIVLGNSSAGLKILENGSSPTFYGIFDVTDLTTADKTYTFPNASGTVVTTGNLTDITAVGTIASGTWNGSTIGIAYGGTGLTSAPSNGQLLVGNGTGYTLATLTQGSGISVTNGAGSITIANTGVTSLAGTANQVSASASTGAVTLSLPQSIAVASSPTFAGLTLSSPLATTSGGTGLASYTAGDLLYASATDTLSQLAVGSNGQVLTISGGVPTWTSTAPSTPHNLLSTQHSDTTAGTVARGDLITGQGASATWSRLALGSSGYILRSDGTDAAWSPTTAITQLGTITTGTWQGSVIGSSYGGTGFSTYATGDLLYASAANTLSKLPVGLNGQILTVSSGNLSWATSATPTPHDLLSVQHSDTTAATVQRGDLITGQGASATWSRLALGSSGYILRSDGTDATWSPTTAITQLGTITTGTWNGSTVGVAYGGTGLTSYTIGDLLYASGATTLARLADVATGSVLLSGGVGAAPIWGTIGATNVTADALDFAEFQDTLDLDAGLTLNQSTNAWTQNYAGTTGTGLTYNAASLTTGSALNVTATSTATTNTALSAVQFNLTNAQATLANTNGVTGLAVNFTNGPTVAGNSEYAVRIQNQLTANTTDNAVAALLLLDNADTTASGTTVVTDAIAITDSGGAGFTNFLNTPTLDISAAGAITGATGITSSGTINFSGLTASKVVFTDGSKNLTSSGTVGVDQGGTGATTFTSNGVLYGNGTSAVQVTAAGSNGQVLLGVTGGAPVFATLSSDASITNAGVLTIGLDAVALGADTTGNYIATLTAGSGLSGSVASEGATPTLTLGNLTSDWTSTGTGNIVLGNSSAGLKILENGSSPTFYGIFDVTDLTTADKTYTFPNASGTVVTTGNLTDITAVGTIASGTWQGTKIGIAYGGTNATTIGSAGSLAYSDGSAYAFSAVGTSGQALVSGGSGAPTWFAPTAGSILFAGTSGVLSQDNASFFWDDSNNRLGLGTTGPSTQLELYSSASADNVLTITSATAAYDPLLKFRTGASPAIQFSLGVDTSDSDTFKIATGSGLGTSDQLTIDASGVTTIANLQLGAQSFETNAGAVSWADMPVTSAATAGTVERYTAFMDGNPMLTVYATSDGAGSVANLGVGIGTTVPAGRLHAYESGAKTAAAYAAYFENVATNATTDGINKYGLYVTSTGTFTGSAGTATNNYGLYVDTPAGADNNYAAVFAGGSVGIGDASPASLFTVGSGDLFQVDSNGDIVKLKNLTYAWPSAHTTNGVLVNDGSGTLTWSTVGASSITANSLDFTEFQGTVDLDSNLTLNQTAYTWTQNYTGTTGTGLTYNADSLTTGTALRLASSSTAGGASGASYLLNLSRSGANDNASHAAYGLYSSVTNTGTTSTNVGGYFSASGATNNYGLIVANGNVGIGTTAPTARLDIKDASWPQVRIMAGHYITNTSLVNAISLADNAGNDFLEIGDTSTSVNETTIRSGLFQTTHLNLVTGLSGNINLLPGGDVGLGTNSPLGQFHVQESGAKTATAYAGYLQNLATNATTDAIDKYGLYITSTGTFTGSAGTATNNYGLYVDTPAGADNNYAAVFAGGSVGIGDASPASLFTVGSGDLFQVDSNGDIVKLKNLTYAWPSAHTTNGVLVNDGSGTLTWSTLGASGITADALDFAELQDTLDLDAALTLNQSTSTWTQNYTGTTGTGLTYNADSLTTGTALRLASSSTAGGASGASYLLRLSRSGTNDNASHTAYGLYSSVTNTGTTSTNVGGYFSASGATNNYGLIVANGNAGIGTTTPSAKFHVYESTVLGGNLGDAQLLARIGGATSNVVMENTWLYRDAAGSDWNTARVHNGISVDSSFLTPGTNTKVWWERDPNNNIQSWGNAANTYLTISAGSVGIGDASPASLFTVGSGDLFQVDSNGDIVKLKNLTYAWPSAHTTNGVLVNDGSGTLTWSTLGASGITADALDFAELQDTLDLDAALTLNQSTSTWTQNYDGTTGTGLTYNADSLTTGTALKVAATSTATTNSGIQQVRFDLTNAQSTTATTSGIAGMTINFTNDPTVSGNIEHALRIRNMDTSNTTDNLVRALLALDNADTTTSGTTIVEDAIRITNSGGSGFEDYLDTPTIDIAATGAITGATDITASGQVNGGDGVVTKVNAGACSDATFTLDTNGNLCVDSTNGRLYFRYSGAWHYAAQTAGFQIPDYESFSYDFSTGSFDSSRPLEAGDFLMPFVEKGLSDGAVHGLYAKFSDVKGTLLKDEHDQISSLTLKTDQNVSTLTDLQASVDQQLLTVSGTLVDHETRIKDLEPGLTALESKVADDEAMLAKLQADLTAQTTLTGTLQTQVSDLQTQVQTLMDFYSTLQLGSVVTADAEGNVDLLGGKLHVSEITAEGMVIEVVDPQAPTIGTAMLYPIAKDQDADGNDDFTGKSMTDPEVLARDGKSVVIATKAVAAKSHVFVTSKSVIAEPLVVTSTKEGEGFTVQVKTPLTEPVSFDWWVVEEK
jgi:hypothetical protein